MRECRDGECGGSGGGETPMKLGAFITITDPFRRGDPFIECHQMAQDIFDTVTVVDGRDTWPREFDWDLIGLHFTSGYEDTDADWVFHLDCDFFFHEQDKEAIRAACERNNDFPALSFYKRQFIAPDRFNLKSRLVIAANKAMFGDRIRFDAGGDLCQPSLDGHELSPDQVPEARIPFYNYEKIIKTEAQITDDVGRMARAWHAHFGEYKLGGPDDASAYAEWYKMTSGRFQKEQEHIPLSAHPKYIQSTIKSLQPGQWGYDGFGLFKSDYIV